MRRFEDAELGVVEMRSATEWRFGGGARGAKAAGGRIESLALGLTAGYGREGGTIAGKGGYTCKYLY